MSTQKSGGNKKKPNKRPGYYKDYYMFRYPVNKLKRILRHNGLSAARSWASKNEKTGILKQLLNKGVKVHENASSKTGTPAGRQTAGD